MPRSPKNDFSRLTLLTFLAGRRLRDEAYQCPETAGNSFSMLQFEALRYVGEKKPLMRELARYFSVTPPAATLLVQKLVDDKLLARKADEHDRRGVRLLLTAKGRQAMTAADRVKMRKLEDVFSVLNHDEQNQLAAILEKVVEKKQEKQDR